MTSKVLVEVEVVSLRRTTRRSPKPLPPFKWLADFGGRVYQRERTACDESLGGSGIEAEDGAVPLFLGRQLPML